MKKALLFLTAILMSIGMRATITIEDGQKYYFVCQRWNTGSMVLGENHGSTAYVYYDTTEELSADSYWTIQKDGNGYTIQNVSNGKYLFYKDERIDGVAKGIQLTDNVTDDSGRWLFEEASDGYVIIYNVSQPGQCFNVRTDGTNLVGTYSNNGDTNSLFNVYNDKGESITGKTEGETGGGNGDFKGGSGTTANGEYWELTGLKQPVVYSTGHDTPVLYSIINLRSGQYASISRNSLTQSETCDTKFYFMQNGTGVTVYTSDGKYISTSFPTMYEGSRSLTAYSGTYENKIWNFYFYNEQDYPGYNIHKAENLEYCIKC
ncbi:MAG: RICIN domain-containing protein, partial [Bacteroidaceae bacterium]|nr:RICIN domain-containing protein [Bacteroidaceae bacterium]